MDYYQDRRGQPHLLFHTLKYRLYPPRIVGAMFVTFNYSGLHPPEFVLLIARYPGCIAFFFLFFLVCMNFGFWDQNETLYD